MVPRKELGRERPKQETRVGEKQQSPASRTPKKKNQPLLPSSTSGPARPIELFGGGCQTMSKQSPVTVPCKYKTGRVLGSGTYAVVKEAIHIDTGKYYAVKVINKQLMRGKEYMIRNEISVLKRVSHGHQNILTMVDYFETQNNLYLVMDLATGGELFDRICEKGNYYENDAANLVLAIVSAVAYLHEQGIVHRDLKPENLLFRTKDEDADLLIADFGLSRIIDSEKFHVLTTTCGTPAYMAPEIFKKSGHGKPVDVWAIGVITYFLLCGYTPFDRDNSVLEMQAILKADYAFEPHEYWKGVSSTAMDFIRLLLVVDPEGRLTAHEALEHPWLKSVAGKAPCAAAADLLPHLRKNFDGRKTFRKAVDLVKLINNFSKSTVDDVPLKISDIRPVDEE